MITPFSHFKAGTVINKDEGHILYRLDLSEGRGTAAIYPVMLGIEIVEMDFQAPQFIPSLHPQKNVLEINHCLKGRAECRMGDGCLQYIGEHDLFLSTLHNHSESIDLPLGYYRGMGVMIDPEQAAPEAERLLSDVSFCMRTMLERFFSEDKCFLIQAREEIRRIFSGMYTIPQKARGIYFRLKVLELLLYLHYFEPQKEPQKSVYARQQVDTIKQIHKQITGEPRRRFAIEELAQQHCISATTLKTGFKEVYDTPIYAYMKNYRVRLAADMLRSTQKSVAEIASKVGYKSQSRFGAAFREIMKMTPLEYRRKTAFCSDDL